MAGEVVEDDQYVVHGPEPLETIPDDTLGKLLFDSLLSNTSDHDAMIQDVKIMENNLEEVKNVQVLQYLGGMVKKEEVVDFREEPIVDVYTEESITFRTLLDESCKLAEALRSYGCSSHSAISVCSENNLNFFIPVLAGLYVGSRVAPLNHHYMPDELKHALNITKPRIIFCSEEASEKFLELQDELQFIEKIILIDTEERVSGTETLAGFVDGQLRGRTVLPHNVQIFNENAGEHVAFVLCSSGTTGLPKGVMLTHRNLVVRQVHSRDPRFRTGDDHNILGLMPFFHGFGLNMGITAIYNAQFLVVLKRFEPDVFLRAIQDYKISVLALAPPLAIFLAKTPDLDQYDLSSVKETFCGAAPLNKEVDSILRKRLKITAVRQAYGLTETNLAVTVMEPGVSDKSGSSGRLITFMSIKVRDPETGKSLGPNRVGEICIKGPSVMKGYYGDPEATRQTFTSDGWLKTGDLGYYDQDEFFFIVDRLKELIKYKGYQVAPAELEAILIGHPKVIDVGVVGLPDEISGELPIAFVVKDDEADVTEKELQDYVAKRVSPQKRLRGGVIFVDSIPKNPSGKILRRELRNSLSDYKPLRESKL